ncbi:MAG: class II fumarate hydratase [Oscillospiraceae bacterium]|nr:class II fumarate hydratase [Oscillospiraceae bacterium]
MESRTEHDSLGEIAVEADKYWGAQTERSRRNFPIGGGRETMSREIISALALMKKAAAISNHRLSPQRMSEEKAARIVEGCDAILAGELWEHFPLVVWQTGSGTQSNMNVNEVVARYGNLRAGKALLHPNDDVNMSQSSNDTFPTAMHIAAALLLERRLLPSLRALTGAFRALEERYPTLLKCGRTHLQDAVPLRFAQEVSGWRSSLEKDAELITLSLPPLYSLALGGTAVGTGLNAPEGFAEAVAREVAAMTALPFVSASNKFHALTSRDELVFAHGAMKALAGDLMKIANDIRWLGSGPRNGLGELILPENEPGSSIMPGKVNPTQCEAVTMVAVQVMANDVAVGLAASQGNFELNVFMPVLADNFIRSAHLLSDAMDSFRLRCVEGLRPNEARMEENLHRSLMLVTALTPRIGYENAARAAHRALREDITLRDACLALGLLGEEELDELLDPERMV